MGSLPTTLHNQVRNALLKCAPFSSQEALQRVFGDPRLAPWKYNVPEASPSLTRVSTLLAQFQDAWTADGQNALALFLCVTSELPERGPECPAAELRILSSEVQKALIKDKIAECERELAQVKEHQARGWSDPDYAQRRITELQAQIQMWKERFAAPPLCPPETPTEAVVPAPSPLFAPETYTDLEIHIAPRDPTIGVYAVTAELDGDAKFYGTLQMGTTERAALAMLTDPVEYGTALFDALFCGDIHTAYTTARERARTQTAGRLRLRLWIDHAAADLHALIWERLHYRSEGGAFRVATDAKLPFSRYFGLQRGAASAISGPTRMLCVIANPQNLDDYTLPAFDVEAEVANLCTALDGLRQSGMAIAIMPGRTGLSADQMRRLKEAGYTVLPGVSSLDRIFEALAYAPGYHLLHFVGHGVFAQHRGQAALLLEDEAGQARLVTDADLTGRLAGLDLKPYLIFLAACESASRGRVERIVDRPNPFVGLAPRMVQIGIPAVVAMQDQIAMTAAQTLTRHFYRFLLQHGIVDKALNQARGFLVDTPDWATPVLFMRLREGRLLEGNHVPLASGALSSSDIAPSFNAASASQPLPSLSPNPFTDMLLIRESARFVGREAELRRLFSLLQSGSVTLIGEPKIGKSSLMLRLAEVWRAENRSRVFGPLDCQGVLDCDDFFAELAKLIGLPTTTDRRALRDALRITSGLLLLDEMDCAPGWGLTADDFALFRAVCSANPNFKLMVVSRAPLKTLFPDSRRGSPSYNFLIPYTLVPLSEADARMLLAHPWDKTAPAFDAATVDALLALAGTHPFKLQRAAHHRYEVLRDPAYDWQTAYRDEITQLL
ncbi:MAG TPA: CHAT domain-containing protein [Anaerolineae bacterium]|nr:CHAT domain-containing protein [Anaerolineae bacterium]HQK12925.1 CHAT domain-containing protein [Anaerolineae bacterium]